MTATPEAVPTHAVTSPGGEPLQDVNPEVKGGITEAMMEDARRRLNLPLQSKDRPWHTQVTADNCFHFSRSLGDSNPLWFDEEYGAGTVWGGYIAHPLFVSSMAADRLSMSTGFPGIHAWWAGSEWEFFEPLRDGDRVAVESVPISIEEKQGAMAGRQVLQTVELRYRRTSDLELVALQRRWTMRGARGAANTKGKYLSTIQVKRWTDAELEELFRAYDDEVRRGPTPRYWEEVEVGDELAPVIKGPLNVNSEVNHLIAVGGGALTYVHKMAVDVWKKNRSLMVRNPVTNGPEFPISVHWSDDFARAVGVPAGYDMGGERIAWLSHLMTNWMGDQGALRMLRVELRRFNIMGDVQFCRGRVTAKRELDGRYLVDCEIWAENQRGEVTAPGSATVELPHRASASAAASGT